MKKTFQTGNIVIAALLLAGCQTMASNESEISAAKTAAFSETHMASFSHDPTATLDPYATTVIDSLTHWNIYTNSKYHFSFSYPPNLTVMGGISGPMTDNPVLVLNLGDVTTGIGGDGPFDGFDVNIVPDLNGASFNAYLEGEKNALLKSGKVMANKDFSQTCSQSTINEPNGQAWTLLKNCGWDGNNRYFMALPNGTSVIGVSTVFSTSGFPKVIDQMLSTFKFQ